MKPVSSPVRSPLRSVPLRRMKSIDNITPTKTPPRAPLSHKSSEKQSASETTAKATTSVAVAVYTDNKEPASTENPSSAKRPKVHNDNAETSAADPTTTATITTTTNVMPLMPLLYPTTVPVPSREIVQSLFEEAIQNNADTYSMDTDDDEKNYTDQQALNKSDAGLLSFTDVLLPAAAYCEEQALKQMQAYVQRDHAPASIDTVKACRKAIYDGVAAAMRAASLSRVSRHTFDEQREEAWRQDVADQAAAERSSALQLQQQEEECRQLEQQRKKSELKKKLPRNQELWREVAYLMTELSKMQKEERLWQQAEHNLVLAEQELDRQEQEQQTKEELEQEQQTDPEMDNNAAAAANDETTKTTTPEFAMVEQTVEDITLSSIRIQQALKIVSGIITDSDQVRKDLYRRYRQDHQFHGYPGVKNTKGLLKVLSQSQDF